MNLYVWTVTPEDDLTRWYVTLADSIELARKSAYRKALREGNPKDAEDIKEFIPFVLSDEFTLMFQERTM